MENQQGKGLDAVGAKHLGDNLPEKPKDDNPNASPSLNSPGNKLQMQNQHGALATLREGCANR